MLRFAEETLLLILDGRGALNHIPEHTLNLVLAGATLMDRALEDRIDTDPEKLVLVDPTPVGDDLIDPTLADIAAVRNDRDARFWLERVAERGDEIRRRALDRLVERRILESAEDGFLFLASGVSRSRLYPTTDGEVEQEVRLRIMRVLFTEAIPDPRDIVIISLVNACEELERILSRDEFDQIRERLDIITRMNMIGRSVTEAIRALRTKQEQTRVAPLSTIPTAPGWPILGNAFELTRKGNAFFVDLYRKLGPVFRVRALNRSFIILAGQEANQFVARNGTVCFSTYWMWRDFHQELGSKRDVISMDGADHIRLRKALARGYSRGLAEKDIDAVVEIIRNEMRRWRVGSNVPAFRALQRMVIQILGRITSGFFAGEYTDTLLFYFYVLLVSRVAHLRPRFLYAVRMRRARKRIDELLRQVMDSRNERRHAGGARDLMDDILDLHRTDPQFMPETDMKTVMLAPFIAGLETMALSSAFMIYTLLKRPGLMEQVRAETDMLFADGAPNPRALRQMDVTHRVALETLRIFPLGSVLARSVANSFDFAGYRIRAGENVMVASAVTHFLDEHFPEPDRFDITRYGPERAEHKQKHTYAPFGLGEHRCLGAGLADVLMVLITATILRYAELAIDPPNYELRMLTLPALRTKGYNLRIVRHL